MKKVKRLLFVLAAGVAIASCEDAIDIVQVGELNEDAAFQSVGDVQAFLNGTYSQASMKSAIGFTSVFTDEAGIGSQSGGQNLDLYKYFLTVDDGFAEGIWSGNYTLINYTNRLLRGAARVTPEASELAAYNSMLAEARVLRAFGHLQLLTYFSTDLKNDNALGVILMDRVPDVDEDLPRSTNGEVFALIEADLAYADANLIDHSGANGYKYVSKMMVNAMRARMYAYRGMYTQAEQYADLVINNTQGVQLVQGGTVDGRIAASSAQSTVILTSTPQRGYPSATNNFYLMTGSGPTNEYAKMLGDFSRGEVIFALSRPALASSGQIADLFYFNRTMLSGGPYHDMDYNLFDLINDPLEDGTTNNDLDIRRIGYVDPTSVIPADPEAVGDFRTMSVICIDKYRGKAGATGADLMNDHKVFRMSEMYLIKAEARIAAGDLNGAAQLVKQIRDARTYTYAVQNTSSASQTIFGVAVAPGTTETFVPAPRPLPTYASPTEAWADVLKERRIELAYEGHRYIDLKRLGAAATTTIDRFHRECETNNVGQCALPLSDDRFTMPVPRAELNANSNIQQNPGYN